MRAIPPYGDDDDDGRSHPAESSLWGLRHPLAQALLLCLLFFLAAKLSVHLTHTRAGVSLLWLPNAVILAAMLAAPTRRWPWYLAAIIPAELVAGWGLSAPLTALGFGFVNLMEVLLAASLIRRFHGPRFSLERPAHVASFGIIALILAPGLAALLGASLHSSLEFGSQKFWSDWLFWWLGDATGLLVLTPALHALWVPSADGPSRSESSLRTWAGAAGLLATALATLALFLQEGDAIHKMVVSPILILPVVLVMAARFGVSGATWAGFTVALISVALTIEGHGPYAGLGSTRSSLLVQEFVMLMALTGFVMAALLHEARRRGDRMRLFRRVIEASDAGIAIADARQPDLPLVFVNPRFEQNSGRSAREILGRNARFLYGRDSDQPGLDRVRTALASGEPIREVLRNQRGDGTTCWNELLLTPIRDEDGSLTHYVGVQHDVTGLIETQRELLAAREELASRNADLEQRVAERTAELERLATTDPLTGVYNRRFLMERAVEEIARAGRQKSPLSLAMLDIDHFKRLNDTHGHAFGDVVLKHLCASLARAMRPSDTLARFGGEEFVVLLPDTDPDGAHAVCQRLREQVEALTLRTPVDDKAISLTISVGVSTLGHDANDLEALLRNADAALYRAKHAGRNRVITYERNVDTSGPPSTF